MPTIRSIAAVMALVSLAACESADQLVGTTIDRYTRPPGTQPDPEPAVADPAFRGPDSTARTSKALTVGPVPGAPDGTVGWISSAEARLVLDLPTLAGGTVTRRRFTSADGRYVEEDAQWTGPTADPVSAGLLLSESTAGPPLTDAEDPRGPVHHWAVFRDRQRGFGELIGSRNVLGPVLWRRVQVGPTTCVAFLQRWTGATPSAPASTLIGYYCAAPGEALSPGEAETVVRSVGIRARKG